MKNLSSKKGITLAALTITVMLFLVILSSITYSSMSSLYMKRLNNMYSDISSLQDKIDLYYLENGVFPSDGTTISKNSRECVNVANGINPNDGDIYYKVDTSKLEGLTLNNGKDTDMYYVNAETHTVYYEKGAQVSATDTQKKYTLDLSDVTDIVSKKAGEAPGILESCQ
jgi:type II secretory pathway pseudopilin PulG